MECVYRATLNPDGTMYCIVCGADLPKSNPSLGMAKPKLAVFHVEETVLDNSAGERIAKRKGLSGKRFGREVAANLEKAVSRIGVKDYINRLARDNYTIAFISSLDSSYQYRLQDRLRHLGFPIMTDTTGPLVLMGDSQDNIRSLARRYDIAYFRHKPCWDCQTNERPRCLCNGRGLHWRFKEPLHRTSRNACSLHPFWLATRTYACSLHAGKPTQQCSFRHQGSYAANMTEAERRSVERFSG